MGNLEHLHQGKKPLDPCAHNAGAIAISLIMSISLYLISQVRHRLFLAPKHVIYHLICALRRPSVGIFWDHCPQILVKGTPPLPLRTLYFLILGSH